MINKNLEVAKDDEGHTVIYLSPSDALEFANRFVSTKEEVKELVGKGEWGSHLHRAIFKIAISDTEEPQDLIQAYAEEKYTDRVRRGQQADLDAWSEVARSDFDRAVGESDATTLVKLFFEFDARIGG